jgi:hypothetical protein
VIGVNKACVLAAAMADVFLTAKDIAKLTRYTRSSAQIRWLRRNSWRFTVNALRQPVVAIAETQRQLVRGNAGAIQGPDFEVLNGQKTQT